jgi:hypothetical protein
MDPENINYVGKNSKTQSCVNLNEPAADSCTLNHCIDNTGSLKILDGVTYIGA